MHYIKLIHSKLTIIIISPVLLITFGKLIIKLMSARVGYVSYNYRGYDVLHRDEKHSE